MGSEKYISVDLETTGLNPKSDKIIEIGAIKVENGEIVDSFETLINPGRKLEQRIIDLTGIKDADLENASYIEEAFEQFVCFLGDYPLLGHSVLFDYSFLKKEAANEKRQFEKVGIDTLKIARKYLDKLEHRNLGFLCEYYDIPISAHRALEDAVATHKLYENLIKDFYKADEPDDIFRPSKLLYKVKRDTPATKAQKERLVRLLDMYKVDLGYDIDRMTRSEASRETDKLLATYGIR